METLNRSYVRFISVFAFLGSLAAILGGCQSAPDQPFCREGDPYCTTDGGITTPGACGGLCDNVAGETCNSNNQCTFTGTDACNNKCAAGTVCESNGTCGTPQLGGSCGNYCGVNTYCAEVGSTWECLPSTGSPGGNGSGGSNSCGNSCPAPGICGPGNVCTATGGTGTGSTGTCGSATCGAGEVCVNGQVCYPACGTQYCTGGQWCVNGSCQTTTCTSTSQCPSGEVCYNGGCVINTNTCGNTCTVNQTCINNVCINNSGCTSSAQCPSGYSCNGGLCQLNGNNNCNGGCPNGYSCDNNVCVQNGGNCNGGCPSGESCVNNVCVQNGGNCNGGCPSGYSCENNVCVQNGGGSCNGGTCETVTMIVTSASSTYSYAVSNTTQQAINLSVNNPPAVQVSSSDGTFAWAGIVYAAGNAIQQQTSYSEACAYLYTYKPEMCSLHGCNPSDPVAMTQPQVAQWAAQDARNANCGAAGGEFIFGQTVNNDKITDSTPACSFQGQTNCVTPDDSMIMVACCPGSGVVQSF